ncbi:hypothetical protein ACWGKW_44910, partial [Streptomyces sp. NPDC054766]
MSGASASPSKPSDERDTSRVMNDIDIHTTTGKLADLQRRIQEATHAGSERAVEKQHAKGKL